jgi:hypothetical protein
MPIKRMTLEEADALGIPRETWVIEFGGARLRKPASPPMTERECRYEWAYQAMCDYEDEAYHESATPCPPTYRAEAKVWALMLCNLGLRSDGNSVRSKGRTNRHSDHQTLRGKPFCEMV